MDTNDEPMFASAASAVEPAMEEGMASQPPEAEEPPSDAELAEALRLLTPASGHADVSSVPSHETLVAAGQLRRKKRRIMRQPVRNGSRNRWH